MEPHRSAILLVLAALGLGLLSAGTVLVRLRKLEADLGEEVPVVVARTPILAGEVIAPSALRLVGVARRYVFPSSFRKPEEVAGKVARVALESGAPVLAAMLAPPDGLVAEQRVYTLAAGDRVVVEPDIEPGDRADVLAAFERGGRQLASVLLRGVRVVRVEGKERISLRISLEDAELLAWAENFGQQIRIVRQPVVASLVPARPSQDLPIPSEEGETRVH